MRKRKKSTIGGPWPNCATRLSRKVYGTGRSERDWMGRGTRTGERVAGVVVVVVVVDDDGRFSRVNMAQQRCVLWRHAKVAVL